MTKKIEISNGDRFGNIIIIKEIESSCGRTNRKFIVQCQKCGRVKTSFMSGLLRSKTGCHCTRGKAVTPFKSKRDDRYKKMYKAWSGILSRCNSPKDIGYKNYGGRGIKNRWENFEQFYLDMKDGWGEGLQIDRIDVDGDYCKDNCRWVTNRENQRNKRNNIRFNDGELLVEVCEKYSIPYKAAYLRYKSGKSLSQIISELYGKK